MEHQGSGEIAGLVRHIGICVCSAIGADGKDAELEATAESEVSGAGGYDYRAAAQRGAADQRDAADHRDPAAVSGFSVLSDDVSAGVSEWGCILPLRAAAESRGEFVAAWIARKDIFAGKEDVWRHSALPGDLLFVWECFVALLRE
jgi:hypothetical protein